MKQLNKVASPLFVILLSLVGILFLNDLLLKGNTTNQKEAQQLACHHYYNTAEATLKEIQYQYNFSTFNKLPTSNKLKEQYEEANTHFKDLRLAYSLNRLSTCIDKGPEINIQLSKILNTVDSITHPLSNK